MAESSNHSVHNTPSDPPLTDSLGKTWRITQSKQVLINGILDRDAAPVVQLAYVNQSVWRQTKDLRWTSKRQPDDDWLPRGGSYHSPLGGQLNQEFEEVEASIAAVLEEVKDLGHDQPAWVPGFIASQAQLLLDYATTISGIIDQNQTATVLLLNAILAKLDGITPSKPTTIILDLDHAIFVPQPVPPGPGP